MKRRKKNWFEGWSLKMWVSTAVGKEMGDNTSGEESGQAKRLKPEGPETHAGPTLRAESAGGPH